MDNVHAVAVLGDDPVATAASALGVARTQALRRRVVLVDLLGEQSDLSAMVGDDAAPGITDMLEYGVSMGRAAHAIPGQTNLFVIPSGCDTPLQSHFLLHPRWDTLVSEFREAGALLVVVAPALVPFVDMLLGRLDGVVVVRGAAVPGTPAPTLADIRLSGQYPATPRRMSAMARSRRGAEPARPSRLAAIALGVAALAALGGSLWYLRPWGGGAVASQEPPAAAAVAPPPVEVAPPKPVPWSIELSRVNSPDGALLRVRQIVDSFPPATYSPVQPAQGGARWFRVVVGAFADSGEAVTFLDAMHQRRLAPESAGLAVRLPLALLVADSLSGAEAVQRATELRGQGLPAYTLPASGGLARLYVGAFDTEEAAAPLMARLDSLNLRSTLAPRVGSVN